MSEDAKMISAKQAVQDVLAARCRTEPGFFETLMLDPNGVIKPLIGEVLGDDGELDLGDISCSVAVETEQNLHFVVTVTGEDPGESEVDGFAYRRNTGLASRLLTSRVSPSLTLALPRFDGSQFGQDCGATCALTCTNTSG